MGEPDKESSDGAADKVHTCHFGDVFNAEKEELHRRFPCADEKDLKDLKDLKGLAFSGGGIRSSSFCLGILQGLFGRNVLKDFHYLSTVSGGGYIGSSLTWFLGQKTPDGCPYTIDGDEARDGKGVFPFGKKAAVTAQAAPIFDSDGNVTGDTGKDGAEQGGGEHEADNDKPDARGLKRGSGNEVLDYIRLHGKYLTPTGKLNLLSLAAIVLKTMILAFLVYVPALTLLMMVLHAVGVWGVPSFLDADGNANYLLLAAGLAGALLLSGSFLFSLISRRLHEKRAWGYRMRNRFQIGAGALLVASVGLGVMGSLPLVSKAVGNVVQDQVLAGGSLTAIGLVGGLFRLFTKNEKAVTVLKALRQRLGAAWSVALVAAILYGLLLMTYALAAAWSDGVVKLETNALCVAAILLVLALTGFAVNVNEISLHRMYRDRLMETFLPGEEALKATAWEPAVDGDNAELCDFARSKGPLHLINTNVILVKSKASKFRQRGGDNFALSPFFCGSEATGWIPTDSYMARRLTLPTAMAISGAAVNPNAGVGGQGPTRSLIVSLLMTLLNIRLGYWAPNPIEEKIRRPNYFVPPISGWFRMIGPRTAPYHSENAPLVELSDGGHFENLGIYELIRRRVKTIVAVDAGQDLGFRFGDFGRAMERIRVDFGVKIRFLDDERDLRWVLPGTGVKDPARDRWAAQYQLAKQGYAIGTIEYPLGDSKDGVDYETGHFIYIKSTLIKGLPGDLYGYKSVNPDFPDETTADQFFDERQFEAYRELGYRICKEMLNDTRAQVILGLAYKS